MSSFRYFENQKCKHYFESFRIGVTNFNNANDLVLVTQMLREVASKHKDLQVYTFQHGRAIADQLNVLLPFTLRNDLIAMACMVVISLLCIPNPICTIWIMLAMFSIEIGTNNFYLLSIN
ncbi:unnamed protein product [Meloidogyne enterolobii]|uniref:Uncharacterized protein n=1 Tax=Meloidogyne enterolobii TaxID=390850 RepID=A0ACB0YE60_MELEN